MVREIIKDTDALSQKCEKITDIRRAREIIKDLLDTALHNNETSEKKCWDLQQTRLAKMYV
jgi:hypothetical protein